LFPGFFSFEVFGTGSTQTVEIEKKERKKEGIPFFHSKTGPFLVYITSHLTQRDREIER